VEHDEIILPCFDCHNGIISGGQATSHMSTTNFCQKCHSVDVWVPAMVVDHNQVIGVCIDCHNGLVAIGGPPSHVDRVAYPDNCENCHSTFRWQVSDFPVGHELATNSCAKAGCHDGAAAPEKTASHINATLICEACHNNTRFSPVNVVNHLEVIGECVNCHNGTISMGQPIGHIAASNNCQACHSTQVWIPTLAVDHVELSGEDCFACHNGTVATGKSPTHIPSDNVCENCHDKFIWTNIILSTEAHYLLAPKTCVSSECHAIGVSHAPSVVEDCSSCHIVADWLNWARPTTQREVPPVTPVL